jgi:hypothetical protein
MRFRPACFFLALLVFAGTTVAQDAPRRDPQALAVLEQSLAVMGATVASDSVSSGSVTSFVGGEELRGNIRILTREWSRCREETDLGGRQRAVIFTKWEAATEEDAQKKRISPVRARSEFCSFLPTARLLAALNDPDAGYEYLGLERIDARSYHHVRVWSTMATVGGLEELAKLTEAEVWIDATSLLPLRITYNIYADDAPNEPIPVEIATRTMPTRAA